MNPSRLLTSSRLSSARACQRLHRLRYIDGWRPVGEEARPLRFGHAMHAGLEAWLKAPETERLDAALAGIPPGLDPFEQVTLEVMLRGYDARWADEPYKVLGVEQEFVTEIRNPRTGRPSQTWKLAGKIDAMLLDLRDGRILICEHKSSSQDIGVGSEYWKRLRIDGQVSVYFDGARALGLDPDACLYDVLRKPGLRPYRATPEASRRYKADGSLYANQRDRDETPAEFRDRLIEAIAADPDAYYRRGEVVRLEAEIDEARWDIWQLGQQIRDAELEKFAPRNPDACVRFGRTCEFFDVCCGEASLDDPARFTRVEKVHAELDMDAA